MKSAIYSELSKATGVKFKDGDDKQKFFVELVKATASLGDPQWDKLSDEAQDWYNAAAKAKNKKEAIVDFPDLEKEEEEEAPRRSRRSADADDEKKDKPKQAEVGSNIVGVTARGKEVKGKVVEIDGDVLVLDLGDGGDYFDFNMKTCKTLDVVAEEEKPRGRSRSEPVAEPEEPELKEGDRAVLVTKRGKEIAGKIVEIDDKGFLLKGDDGEEYDYEFDGIKSLLPEKAGKAAKEEEDAPRRGRGSSKDKEEPAKDEARTRSTNEGGASVGTRIQELIAEDLEISEADIIKQLKKEGLNFKENTVSINYKSAHKFIAILKDAKRLK
ncbi:hypothetical protein ZHS_68 [Edwardsiella phage vB_EpM_ZHS]|jgi:hypothetical protein|nr:hypothetical protein ZHS_68 [Edwardsiella phage vB_EpM_ZHS]